MDEAFGHIRPGLRATIHPCSWTPRLESTHSYGGAPRLKSTSHLYSRAPRLKFTSHLYSRVS